MSTALITANVLSDLIGTIYDCAFDPSRWSGTLQAINSNCGFASAGIEISALPSGRILLHTMADGNKNWQPSESDHEADWLALWGGRESIQSFPLDEPILHSTLHSLPPLQVNQCSMGWLQPQGFLDAVGIAFARDSTMVGFVGFYRHVSAGPVGAREVGAMRVLAPHFRRVIAISKLHDLATIASKTVDVLLNGFRVGVVFVDENLGIVHANAAAEAMLTSRNPILSRHGRLATLLCHETAILQAAVAQAANEEHRHAYCGISVPLRSKDGPPCVVHILPLSGGDLGPELRQRARAALFIASADLSPQMPQAAVSLIYDLTPAEARVFHLIVDGRTPSEIAGMLDVAVSTVRTHLLHLFGKTGCNRQGDLIKLAGSLSMPL